MVAQHINPYKHRLSGPTKKSSNRITTFSSLPLTGETAGWRVEQLRTASDSFTLLP